MLLDDVQSLLYQILQILVAPFQGRQSRSNTYPPPREESLSFFPVLPRLHGDATYKADGVVSASGKDTCRKNSMTILPYHLEFLLYTVSMACVMDSKSYRSVSFHGIHFEVSRVVSSRLQN